MSHGGAESILADVVGVGAGRMEVAPVNVVGVHEDEHYHNEEDNLEGTEGHLYGDNLTKALPEVLSI